MDILEEMLEPGFDLEPQFRERSNTWPLRPNRVDLLEVPNGGSSSPVPEEATADMVVAMGAGNVQVKQEKGSVATAAAAGGGGDPLGLTVKKSGARRNAWGSLSYADLITNAIQSSPDKRLTLSQIYDWMVQNVPYFKDKGDSTSSAGWKNSIRHNLSLHSRFMRIQNEGTGKSSWWVVNPDVKTGKTPRRRAGSMDTKSGEKKRGRLNKKKQEAIRSALENRGSPLNGSIDFLDTLNLGDFRSRASSNASSCSRLSPIPPDLHDNQVPPMSPIPWDGEMDLSGGAFQGTENFPDLASSLADSMNLSSQDSMDMTTTLNSDPYLSSGMSQDFNSPSQNFSSMGDGLNEPSQFSHLPAPPPYPERTSPAQTTQHQEKPAFSTANMSNLRRTLINTFADPDTMYKNTVKVLNLMNRGQLSINTQQQSLGTPEGSQQNSPSIQTLSLNSPIGRSNGQEDGNRLNRQLSPQQQQALLGSSDQQAAKVQQQNALQQQQQQTKSILRSALTHGVWSSPSAQLILGMNQSASITPANSSNVNANFANLGLSPQRQIQQLQQLQQQQQQQQPPQQPQQPQQLGLSTSSNSFMGQLGDSVSTGPVVNNVLMQANANNLTNGNNNLPDIDMDTESFSMSDVDVDQILKQELILDGNLDANFDNITPA